MYAPFSLIEIIIFIDYKYFKSFLKSKKIKILFISIINSIFITTLIFFYINDKNSHFENDDWELSIRIKFTKSLMIINPIQ